MMQKPTLLQQLPLCQHGKTVQNVHKFPGKSLATADYKLLSVAMHTLSPFS